MLVLQKFALYLMIFCLPFNGLRPVLDIGELSRDGFFFGSLFYLAVFAVRLLSDTRGIFRAGFSLPKVHLVYLALILGSLFASFYIIAENAYGSRTGFEKYFVSLSTYLYYLFLSSVLYLNAKMVGIERFTSWCAGAFTIVGVFLTIVCAIEIASWYFTPLRSVMLEFRSLFADNPLRRPFRLSGVSLEPSFNAFALLACVPWAIFRSASSGRLRYKLLATALLALCVVSAARTAYVGLAIMAVTYLLTTGVLRRMLPAGLDGAALIAMTFAVGVAFPVLASANIGADSTISDASRGYLMMGALSAGLDNFWGQGFGQASFYLVRNVSSAVQYSWELLDFYRGARHGELPPLFSWYARTFGEFGVVGYVILGVSFSLAARRFFRVGHAASDPFTRQLFILAALLVAQFLAIAFSIDSVRVPQFWLAWLFAGLLVAHARQQRPIADHG